ncbi:hypothetical protein [Runella slithyformis]|uniref:hypothetical protein n=1 Tax=Runella slithyformis TaxID=106 RepID=UPI001469AAB8|nr:hypothetical protein [Runella slithyformis]
MSFSLRNFSSSPPPALHVLFIKARSLIKGQHKDAYPHVTAASVPNAPTHTKRHYVTKKLSKNQQLRHFVITKNSLKNPPSDIITLIINALFKNMQISLLFSGAGGTKVDTI